MVHPDVQKLAELTESAAFLLTQHGENHWSSWLALDARRIRSLDLYGVEHLLHAFGGMGSINDLVIHPLNGHQVTEEEIGPANEKLSALLAEITSLAKKLYAEEANVRKAP